MIIEYRDRNARKNPGCWYTYTYDNGIRVTLAEYQGDLTDLEDYGRELARLKCREIRMRVHTVDSDRLHSIYRSGRKQSQ